MDTTDKDNSTNNEMPPVCATSSNEDNRPQPLNGVQKKKRKFKHLPHCPKKAKKEPRDTNYLNLLEFPDDILLIILSHLPHHSLLQLKETCTLFSRLCEDYTLWKNVYIIDTPATKEDVKTISKLVHKDTKEIVLTGSYVDKDTQDDVITYEWMSQINIKCPNLERLGLPRQFIDCRVITINSFPSSITHLSLSHTYLRFLPHGRSYFRDVSVFIPNLKVLILSHCDWFEPHSLMAISKCQYLEELRLNDCEQVKDCLAYCGISTRGFRALKTLDLRRCLVTTSELVCFTSVPTLINLYLENALVGGQYSPVFIDSAIVALCIRNELEVRLDGARDVVNRPHLKIERLMVRHFHLLNDVTLLKLARGAHNLQFIDVTGSGVTLEGIKRFQTLRPNVLLVNDEVFSRNR